MGGLLTPLRPCRLQRLRLRLLRMPLRPRWLYGLPIRALSIEWVACFSARHQPASVWAVGCLRHRVRNAFLADMRHRYRMQVYVSAPRMYSSFLSSCSSCDGGFGCVCVWDVCVCACAHVA